ncbi:MAG: UDP-N-acetylmuramate dehydrogenase [Methylococcaceae bacterium]|nr:UDP-N-acetylmuramate dehydrogenase [Methylococcaceae bacterium]
MAQLDPKPCPQGDLLIDQPLANYCSWRVGGNADRLFRPRDKEGLAAFLKELPSSEPVFWLGMGSNLLIRDKGIRGAVINTRGRLNLMKMEDSNSVYAEAGVLCPHLARFCSEQALSGAEFFAGIPGTLGGALAMNAGAFGAETWTLVEQVLTVSRDGVRRIRERTRFDVGYRHVSGPADEFFLAAKLKLKSGDGTESRNAIKTLLAKRTATQPLNLPSCGSVFRNPPNDHAARLIEASGLKGYTIGGAAVSEKHANFILNKNRARAADIEALIEFVRAEVERKQGVRLIPEVQIVGEP